MALHFLAFKLVNYLDVKLHHKESYMVAQFPSSNWDWWYLYLIVGIAAPVIVLMIYDKVAIKVRSSYCAFANRHKSVSS